MERLGQKDEFSDDAWMNVRSMQADRISAHNAIQVRYSYLLRGAPNFTWQSKYRFKNRNTVAFGGHLFIQTAAAHDLCMSRETTRSEYWVTVWITSVVSNSMQGQCRIQRVMTALFLVTDAVKRESGNQLSTYRYFTKRDSNVHVHSIVCMWILLVINLPLTGLKKKIS